MGALTVMGESRENGVNWEDPRSTGGGAGDGGSWHSHKKEAPFSAAAMGGGRSGKPVGMDTLG